MHRHLIALACLSGLSFGCSSLDETISTADEKNASAVATFHDFQWEGVVETSNCYRPDSAIDQQLLYTVGQLNGDNSVGRLDQVQITDSACCLLYTSPSPRD